MEDIYYEKILNRIIQGRLRIRLGDLVLFVHEPDRDILEESYEIYQQAYDQAYYSGVYIQDEILELLLKNNMWSPLDDREADDLEKKLDNLKVEAFKSFVHKKKLAAIKRQIRNTQRKIVKFRSKKHQLDHVTCQGVAHFTRKCWIIRNTTKLSNGELFDFDKISISAFLDIVSEHSIDISDVRKISRTSPFRTMWLASKKAGNLFGKQSSLLDSNQMSLVSFCQMYDNVYEHPESPSEKIINDDDCLDGWFIVQHRKYEKDKKKSEVDAMLSNEKIANSGEIFLMAKNQEDVNNIYDLNDPVSRNTIKSRETQLQSRDESTDIKFTDLQDVRQNMILQARGEGMEQIKSKAKGRR